MKILPVRLYGPDGYENIYALLDEGSTVTLIDKQIARKIGLRGSALALKIKGFGGGMDVDSEKVDVTARGAFDEVKIRGAILVENLDLPAQTISAEYLENMQIEHREKDISPYYEARPKILIGQDNIKIITTRESEKSERSDSVISRSL